MLVVNALFFFSSCSDSEYDFKDSDDAVNVYTAYLHELRKANVTDQKSLTSHICKWQEISDTVYNFIAKDSLKESHDDNRSRFFLTNDSIRKELQRLASTSTFTLKDVIDIKLATSPYRNDKEVKQAVTKASEFFARLDKTKTVRDDKDVALTGYSSFLAIYDNQRYIFRDEKDMLSFIEREDVFFRLFLLHLHEYSGVPLSSITKSTERICTKIFKAASEGKIDPCNAMVYMSMRTNRRLLLNATTCIEQIRARKVKDSVYGKAYLWMMLQPFSSIDGFGMACCTAKDISRLQQLAVQLPTMTKYSDVLGLQEGAFTTDFPSLFVSMYIASL